MNDLTRHSTVRQLVEAFRAAEATVRASFADIVEAEKRLSDVFTLGNRSDRIRIDASRNGYHDSFDDPDHAIQMMARQAWQILVERLELRKMMSVRRWDELERQLKNGELPPITEESVNAFARGYMVALPDMIGEAVAEVFHWLRPNDHYKTNTQLEIGRKVILEGMIEPAWLKPGYRVDYNRQQRLVALENVFRAIDGQGNIAPTYYSELQTAIEASGASGCGETSLFKFKAFRKGTLHLEMRRLDLLAKFNQMAGGKNLRPAKVA